MRREQTLEEISDGKLYDSNDMVKADCHDCEGCCDCCQGMGDSVLLDPYDVYRLSAGLQKSAEQLLQEYLELGVTDGNILPHLRMTGVKEQCIFLNSEGRCHIHSIRPGFCRLFPLGRLYENGSFKYIHFFYTFIFNAKVLLYSKFSKENSIFFLVIIIRWFNFLFS